MKSSPTIPGRDRTIYGPWHYLPVLATKPGGLRNGAPFQGWELTPALARLRRKLGTGDDADRWFVRVLAAVLDDGLEAVEAAVREALLAGTTSCDVIVSAAITIIGAPVSSRISIVLASARGNLGKHGGIDHVRA